MNSYCELPEDPENATVCGGVGKCVRDEATTYANASLGSCLCPSFYDSSFRCEKTFFYSYQRGAEILGWVFLPLMFILWLFYGLEIAGDFALKRNKVSYKKPMFLSKVAACLFFVFRFYFSIFWIVNGSRGWETLWYPQVYYMIDEFGLTCLLVASALIVATWSEIVETSLKLEDDLRNYYQRLRMFLLISAGLLLGIIIILTSLKYVYATDQTYLGLAVVSVEGLYGYAIMIVCAISIVRGWKLSKTNKTPVTSRVRNKTIILFSVNVFGMLYVTISIIASFYDTIPWLSELAIAALFFVFIQNYTYRKRLFDGFLKISTESTKKSTKKSNERASSALKSEGMVKKSRSPKASLSSGSTVTSPSQREQHTPEGSAVDSAV